MGITSRKNGIEHIDTNILVRLIVKDDLKQLKRIKKLFSKENKLYVFEDAAMMEVVFVLAGVYKFTRERIVKEIKTIMQIPNLVCNKSLIEGALDFYVAHPKLSFVDCYLVIATEATQEKPLWTLNRKLVAQCSFAKEPQ